MLRGNKARSTCGRACAPECTAVGRKEEVIFRENHLFLAIFWITDRRSPLQKGSRNLDLSPGRCSSACNLIFRGTPGKSIGASSGQDHTSHVRCRRHAEETGGDWKEHLTWHTTAIRNLTKMQRPTKESALQQAHRAAACSRCKWLVLSASRGFRRGLFRIAFSIGCNQNGLLEKGDCGSPGVAPFIQGRHFRTEFPSSPCLLCLVRAFSPGRRPQTWRKPRNLPFFSGFNSWGGLCSVLDRWPAGPETAS